MIIVRGEGSLARCVLTWRVAMLVVFGLAACGGNDRPPAPHPIFSPNAEILAVKQPQDKLDVCTNALIAWFRRVDTNHDGRIDHDEFVADADRWFSVVDADHDGFAEPAETAAIHAKVMPWDQAKEDRDRDEEAAMLREQQDDEARAREQPQRDRMGNQIPFQKSTPRRQVGVSIDLDPIMAADTNLDNKVSKDEFMAMADRHFDALDVKRDGMLTQDEVAAKCSADEKDWEAAEANSRR